MFERCLYFNVNAFTRAVNRIWDDAYAEFGLSPAHAYLLRLVLSEPGLTAKQIGQELKLEKSTVTRFLDALEQKALLRRKKSTSHDAREKVIYPTVRAEKIARELEETGHQLYEKMTKTIGKTRFSELVARLREIEPRIK